MTRRELHKLERLLKQYRADHTWTTIEELRGNGRDSFRKNADSVIADLRRLLHNGSSYALPEFATAQDADSFREDYSIPE